MEGKGGIRYRDESQGRESKAEEEKEEENIKTLDHYVLWVLICVNMNFVSSSCSWARGW